jgi:Protein of unknown function (DUF3987)/Bifunctional DNA primase/polymerase, N-terminal
MKSISSAKLSFRQRVLRQARIFLLRSFLVLPILPRKKTPRTKGWPDLRLEIRELDDAFGPEDNIGCLLGAPSGGLVDVDLDSPQAIAISPSFLPETGRIHGRGSKPESHRWYIVEPSPSPMQFADVDGTMLLELRSTGQQTLIPPSVHPNGERLFWNRAKEPGHVQSTELRLAVQKVASGALIARHWPSKGSRHELTLALAGFLLRNGWSLEEVRHFVTAAAFASMSDEEWKSRQSDVASTLDRLTKGMPATGMPRLAALVGDDVVSKLTEWLEISPRISGALHQSVVVSWPAPAKPDAFRGLAGEIVSIIEPHSEADPMALLSQFLVGFGNVIGRSAYFPVEADRHHANLFAVLVGPTSKARKGSALSHIKKVLRESDVRWADNSVLSGLSSGEGLVWAVRDPAFSKDGDKIIDVGVEDKRLLAVESEFAQPLKVMARETNILSTILRQAWDSGNLRTLTKNNPAQATGAYISIIGHITQQELRRYLNETELGNGFGNRFLWLCVKRSKMLPEGGKLDDDDLLQLTERLETTINWGRRVKRMHRSDKARKLWADVYPELSKGSAGLLGAVTSRAEAQVTRLSLIYALLDRSSRIQTQHLKAALALWDYAEASARFIFGDSLGDPVADEILRALRVSPSGLTRTEISNLFAGHRKSTDIGRALVVLSQSGLASCRPEATGGRPDERWTVLAGDAKNAKKE